MGLTGSTGRDETRHAFSDAYIPTLRKRFAAMIPLYKYMHLLAMSKRAYLYILQQRSYEIGFSSLGLASQYCFDLRVLLAQRDMQQLSVYGILIYIAHLNKISEPLREE